MKKRLKKELGLFDVFAISTGAMFSSGFFLLPGLASHMTGSSVFIAYLLAGLLITPSMFSIAEISTALPRSGGAYFFLDRSLGPLMGTIGGIGTYLALMFKTTFAIIGIGAYAAFFWQVPVKGVAIVSTFLFMGLNLIGAKKTSGLQRYFVTFLIGVLVVFILDGFYNVFWVRQFDRALIESQFTPLFTNGFEGLLATSGFVFVSFLGLTQIASVAEEIKRPERNIPLGMLLSLVITGLIYFFGVFVMVAVIKPEDFVNDLAPAATAIDQMVTFFPGNVATYLMIGAAIAAFASTGNAGLLSASRYPFAMSRDKLFPGHFEKISSKGTPTAAILLTTFFILLFILFLSEEGIVKMASTFQLLIFLFINFSVIIFRESNIESYDPGFLSPGYPYMQIAGILISLVLIIYMGWIPVLLTCLVILGGYLWYTYHVKKRVKREGAIYHWFAHLAQYQYPELEKEFMMILKEKGLRAGDPFDETIIQSRIITPGPCCDLNRMVTEISQQISEELQVPISELEQEFLANTAHDTVMFVPEVALLYARHEEVKRPMLYMSLIREGIPKPVEKEGISVSDTIRVAFFLLHPVHDPKQQLRMLSRLIDLVEREQFVEELFKREGHREIKEYMLQNERFISVRLLFGTVQAEMIDKQLKEIQFPSDILVALVERDSQTFAPHGNTRLQENDILTMIGEPKSISFLFKRYLEQE